MKKTILVLASIICFATGAFAIDDMRKVLSNPDPKMELVFFGLKLNTRLDMIDYYDAKSSTVSRDDIFASEIRIDTLEDRHVRFDTDTPVSLDTYLLTPGADSLAVTVVSLPIANGDVAIYIDDIRQGKTIDNVLPRYSDWLTKDALKQTTEATLLAAIPFVTASATVDTAKNTVTLTNTAITTPGIDPFIISFFKPTLTLRWDGKKFKP